MKPLSLRNNRGLLVTYLMAVAIFATSCGGSDEKNYAIPERLCDVQIEPRLLEPLLTGGDRISSRPWSNTLPSCRIYIDSKSHGNMVLYPTPNVADPVDRVRRSHNLTPDQVAEWDVENGGAIWTTDSLSGAEIAFICPYNEPDKPHALFSFDIGGRGQIGDEDERRERIKEFSLNYLEGIKNSLCNL